jgi:hypothetical protein
VLPEAIAIGWIRHPDRARIAFRVLRAALSVGALAIALGVLVGCGHAGSGDAKLEGTIGFPSSEGLKTVYVLVSPKTGRVKRLRVRPKSAGRVSLFWYDGARIWTLDDGGVSLLTAGGAVRKRIRLTSSTPLRGIGGLSWSPDGERFVYTDGGGLFVASARGGKPKRLAAGKYLYDADWSPQGDRVAFVAEDAPGSGEGTGEGRIEVVSLDGGGRRSVARGMQPDISPDGKQLAFATLAGVWVMPLEGGKRKLVAPYGAHPEWSPDGHYLAFTRDVACDDVGCRGRVFVTPSAGDWRRALGPRQFDIGSLFWSS